MTIIPKSPTESQTTALDYALQLAGLGWHIFPCHEKPWQRTDPRTGEVEEREGKEPYTTHGKDDATTDPGKIRTWWKRWPAALIGVYCEKSGFFAVDLDVKDGAKGLETWDIWIKESGETPAAVAQITPSSGYHVLFTLPQDLKIPSNVKILGPGVDLRCNAYICTGGPYRWDFSPFEYNLGPAPDWLLEKIRHMVAKPERTRTTSPGQAATTTDEKTYAAGYWLDHYLAITSPGNRNDNGFNLATQLRDNGLSQSEAEGYMMLYCGRVPGSGYTESAALASLKSAYSQAPREPAKLPRMNAPISRNGRHAEPTEPEAPPDARDMMQSTNPGPGDLTDAGNADRLVKHYGELMRWVGDWGWLMWDGARWLRDKSGLVMRFAKKTARNIYREAAEAGDDDRAKSLASWAGKSLNKTRLDAMLDLARSEIPATPADFDADPMVLNLQNGMLDLRTGELQPHDPRQKVTKIAGTYYDPEATCPTWEAFLLRILVEKDVIDFVQRAFGYTLTGMTVEQALFFLYGTGANGKSTFIRAILDILGEYGRQAAPQFLMMGDRHPTEIADLHGARFVATIEVEEGRRLAEVLVKQLTGGDRMKARFMRHDFFEFDPQHKIFLAANHKPVIRGTDYAIWRRIRMIPFGVTIPPAEQDPNLGDKLRAELPGILAWAVRGCLEWQRVGLAVPAKIKRATEEYQAEMDIIGQFLDERTITSDLISATSGELHAAYKAWCEEYGETSVGNARFSRLLEQRGIVPVKKPDGSNARDHRGRAYYQGFGLLSNDGNTPND